MEGGSRLILDVNKQEGVRLVGQDELKKLRDAVECLPTGTESELAFRNGARIVMVEAIKMPFVPVSALGAKGFVDYYCVKFLQVDYAAVVAAGLIPNDFLHGAIFALKILGMPGDIVFPGL
ncbi:hypothetical protein HY008_00335 [Candidatus Woesebacteria bacterium]|nr:hypothetical protein [Candidatus Woesebacteria bacterium]